MQDLQFKSAYFTSQNPLPFPAPAHPSTQSHIHLGWCCWHCSERSQKQFMAALCENSLKWPSLSADHDLWLGKSVKTVESCHLFHRHSWPQTHEIGIDVALGPSSMSFEPTAHISPLPKAKEQDKLVTWPPFTGFHNGDHDSPSARKEAQPHATQLFQQKSE